VQVMVKRTTRVSLDLADEEHRALILLQKWMKKKQGRISLSAVIRSLIMEAVRAKRLEGTDAGVS
jgi:hypothetical protein